LGPRTCIGTWPCQLSHDAANHYVFVGDIPIPLHEHLTLSELNVSVLALNVRFVGEAMTQRRYGDGAGRQNVAGLVARREPDSEPNLGPRRLIEWM